MKELWLICFLVGKDTGGLDMPEGLKGNLALDHGGKRGSISLEIEPLPNNKEADDLLETIEQTLEPFAEHDGEVIVITSITKLGTVS